jgi:molybdopterin molybdotransferase
MRGFKQTTKADRALRIFFDALQAQRLESEYVLTSEALNRVLAEDIVANVNIPAFDRAAMDGYAVLAEDTYGASQTNPAILRIIGKVDMGVPPSFKVSKREAATITTGAPMPAGADSVLMMEYTKKISDVEIEVYAAVTPGENVSRAGEDVKRGDIVLRSGMRLKPQDLGMLAALGFTDVSVVRKPKVAIVSTGNELVECGVSAEPGKIVNINRVILSALVEELGGTAIYLGIAGDSMDEITSQIKKGLAETDIVLATGGTSVGETDLVPEAINSLGKPGMVVHGVSIRPGMPTGLAVVNRKPMISLSGYPVAAMIGFNTFVRPLLLKLLGAEEEPVAEVVAKMPRRVASTAGARTFVRVKVKYIDGEYVAEPIRSTGSGLLSSMTKANGLIVIPEEKEGIEAEEEVRVVLFRPIETERNE